LLICSYIASYLTNSAKSYEHEYKVTFCSIKRQTVSFPVNLSDPLHRFQGHDIFQRVDNLKMVHFYCVSALLSALIVSVRRLSVTLWYSFNKNIPTTIMRFPANGSPNFRRHKAVAEIRRVSPSARQVHRQVLRFYRFPHVFWDVDNLTLLLLPASKQHQQQADVCWPLFVIGPYV